MPRTSPSFCGWLRYWLAVALLLGSAFLPAQAQDMQTYTITLKQGLITPATLEVPAGKRIKLVLQNEGPGPSEFENLAMHVEKILAPGAQSFVVLPSLRSGRYQFVDEFHPEAGGLTLIAR